MLVGTEAEEESLTKLLFKGSGSIMRLRRYGSMESTRSLTRQPPSRDTVSGSMTSVSSHTSVSPGTGYPVYEIMSDMLEQGRMLVNVLTISNIFVEDEATVFERSHCPALIRWGIWATSVLPGEDRCQVCGGGR